MPLQAPPLKIDPNLVSTMTLNRDNMRALKGTGHLHEITDEKMTNLVVRVPAHGRNIAYTLRFQKPNGKRGRKTLGHYPAMQPDEAREAAANTLKFLVTKQDSEGVREDKMEKAKAVRQQTTDITGLAYLEQYTPVLAAKSRSWKSVVMRTKDVKKACASLLALPLSQLTRKHAIDWRASETTRGVANATTNRRINYLKGMLSAAKEAGFIKVSPLRRLRDLPEPKGRVRYLKSDEDRRLHAALDRRDTAKREARRHANAAHSANHRPLSPDLDILTYVDYLRPMIELALQTGLRWQEESLLTWGDLDFDLEQLHVRAETCKTGEERYVPLNREALYVLKQWRAQSPCASNPAAYVFSENGDGAHFLGSVRTAWLHLLEMADIGDFHWHDLRHTFASRAAMAGVSLTALAEWLGQTTEQVTKRYIHLTPSFHKHNINKVNQHNRRFGKTLRPTSGPTDAEMTSGMGRPGQTVRKPLASFLPGAWQPR